MNNFVMVVCKTLCKAVCPGWVGVLKSRNVAQYLDGKGEQVLN